MCRLLYQRGYTVGHDGNVSLRLGEDQILVTPSGVGKGRLRPEMLVKCALSGEVLEGDRHPSSETPMHLMVYRERSDVRAVVHAHPPMATAFAVCRRPLGERYLTETVSGLGEVPVAPFALPSTREVRTASAPLCGTTARCCWPTTGPWPGGRISGLPLTGWRRWSRRPGSTPMSSCWGAAWS